MWTFPEQFPNRSWNFPRHHSKADLRYNGFKRTFFKSVISKRTFRLITVRRTSQVAPKLTTTIQGQSTSTHAKMPSSMTPNRIKSLKQQLLAIDKAEYFVRRNRRRVIAELKEEKLLWDLYGPVSDEEKKEKEEKERVKSVGDFIKNWCNPNIEFLIFSYFAKSPFKHEITTQLYGNKLHMNFDGHKWNLDADPFRSERSRRMNNLYAYTYHHPQQGSGRVISHWENIIRLGPRASRGDGSQLIHKNINTVVKQLWEMRILASFTNGDHLRLSGKEIYNILEENNLGKNKTQRKKLSPHRFKPGNRIPAIKLLMSI